MFMPHEIFYFCLFLEYQLFRFLLTFWDLCVTFFHWVLIYMINFNYWMSLCLKHIKCLEKRTTGPCLFSNSMPIMQKNCHGFVAKSPIIVSWNWYNVWLFIFFNWTFCLIKYLPNLSSVTLDSSEAEFAFMPTSDRVRTSILMICVKSIT